MRQKRSEGGKIVDLSRVYGVRKKGLGFLQVLDFKKIWWRFTDSNRGPVDYDSIALTD
jgi:hypothetical protein